MVTSTLGFDPSSCNNSESITIDIPHTKEVKRSFIKLSSTKGNGSSRNIFLGDETNLKTNVVLPSSQHYFAWEGQDPMDGSTFTYVQDFRNGNLAGSLIDLTNHEVYQFHNHVDGSMSTTITKSNDFYPEIDAFDLQSEMEETLDNQGSNRSLHTSFTASPLTVGDDAASRRLNDNGSVLDIMVIWTAEAECQRSYLAVGCTLTSQTHSNMVSLVNLAITETNIAFSGSGIQTQLQLVHAYRHPTFVEVDMIGTLEALAGGYISGVHSNRANYGADIVSMLINDSKYCG